jgi:hypothetical protein
MQNSPLAANPPESNKGGGEASAGGSPGQAGSASATSGRSRSGTPSDGGTPSTADAAATNADITRDPSDVTASRGGRGAPGVDFGEKGPRVFEMVLACGPKGIAIFPGDYRVKLSTLKTKDTLLPTQILALVRKQEAAEPAKEWSPRIRFLVEPDGRESYTRARVQLAMAGIDWPLTFQFSGSDVPQLFAPEDW